MHDSELLTVSEAARRLKLHPVTVRNMLRAGTIGGMKVGTQHWRVPEVALAEFIESRRRIFPGNARAPELPHCLNHSEGLVAMRRRLLVARLTQFEGWVCELCGALYTPEGGYRNRDPEGTFRQCLSDSAMGKTHCPSHYGLYRMFAHAEFEGRIYFACPDRPSCAECAALSREALTTEEPA